MKLELSPLQQSKTRNGNAKHVVNCYVFISRNVLIVDQRMISIFYQKDKMEKANIGLTCNPSVAWFVHQLLSTNHDTPDCQVETVVLRGTATTSPSPRMAKAMMLIITPIILLFMKYYFLLLLNAITTTYCTGTSYIPCYLLYRRIISFKSIILCLLQIYLIIF